MDCWLSLIAIKGQTSELENALEFLLESFIGGSLLHLWSAKMVFMEFTCDVIGCLSGCLLPFWLNIQMEHSGKFFRMEK